MTADERMRLDLAHLSARPDAARWRSAWRAKERWYARWERDLGSVMSGVDSLLARNLPAAVVAARRGHDPVEKTARDDRVRRLVEQVIAALEAGIGEGLDAGRRGAVAAYVGMALDEAEDAGQLTLDALGLNSTFAWASQRDFVRDGLAVRGSRVIQGLYGNHVARLARIIVDATDPAAPKTVDEVVREILAEWPLVAASDARRVARTETGIVWERTNWYAMRANGILSVRWLVAHGPAIGARVGPVCPACLAMAAGSPYPMDSLREIPPKHPNCRCTLIPVLDSRWLPPARPWTGSEAPLPTRGLADASGTSVPADAPVLKSGRRWGAGLPTGWEPAPGRGW